jgi:[acyl-carrier-protein] S-malonyltransferase
MAKKIAFLFPGQGAQIVGMGRDFYDHFRVARDIFDHGEEILSRPLRKIVFEGPAETLTETYNSQTGIYVTSIAILNVLKEQLPTLQPVVCAGLSLGEYTALTASGRVPFESCLPLVQFRGEAMQAACEATKGTMAAIFGLSAGEVEALVRDLNLPHDLWAANFNCPGQTVISGTLKGVEAGCAAAKERGAKKTVLLKVHGAFHSGLMQVAEQRLAAKLREITILPSSIGFVMNVLGNYVHEIDHIRDNLIRQVTSAVRWEQAIRAMMPSIDLYVEIGCGKTLAGMNRQIGVSVPTISVNTLKDLDQLAEAI